jgi:transposase
LDQRQHVFEIPVARYQVTEHRTRQLRCSCGQQHQSQFADGVTEVMQYGPNVRAPAVHRREGQLLPLGRSAQLITQLFALKVSPATVLAWIGEASARLRPNIDRIAQALIDVPVAHADASDLRVASRLHWLHTGASQSPSTTVHARRSQRYSLSSSGEIFSLATSSTTSADSAPENITLV